MKLSTKRGYRTIWGGAVKSSKKYRTIRGIAAIVSQYRAIWATKCTNRNQTEPNWGHPVKGNKGSQKGGGGFSEGGFGKVLPRPSGEYEPSGACPNWRKMKGQHYWGQQDRELLRGKSASERVSERTSEKSLKTSENL